MIHPNKSMPVYPILVLRPRTSAVKKRDKEADEAQKAPSLTIEDLRVVHWYPNNILPFMNHVRIAVSPSSILQIPFLLPIST